MKKIISWIASFILVSSTSPVFSHLISISNFNNENITINHNSKPIIDFNELGKQGYSYYPMNDHLGVFKEYNKNSKNDMEAWLLLDTGQFIDLGKQMDSFSRMNDHLGVFIEYVGKPERKTYFLDDKGTFILLNKEIANFERINNHLGLGTEFGTQEAWLLSDTGQFIDLGKKVHSFSRMNDNIEIFTEYNTNEDYLLDVSMPNNPVWTDLHVTSENNGFTRFNDHLGVLNQSGSGYRQAIIASMFLDDKGNKTYLNRTGCFYRFNDSKGIFVSIGLVGIESTTYFLDELGQFTKLDKNISDVHSQDERFGNRKQFVAINSHYGTFIEERGEKDWILSDTGQFIDLGKKDVWFARMNDNFQVAFIDWKAFLLSSPINPADIDTLKSDVHFDLIDPNKTIVDVNNTQFSGKVTNGDVNFNINNPHVLAVYLDDDSKPLPLISGKVDVNISSVGNHKLVIKNDLTTDLIYKLYIKKTATVNSITSTAGDTLKNYVGVDNKNNLIDVLQVDHEIKFMYDNFLVKENVLNTIDSNFKIINSKDILNNDKTLVLGNYLIQTTDIIGNSWQQYLTIGSLTITNFWDTTLGQKIFTEALLHKYTDKNLHNMKAIGIQHVVEQYNSGNWDTKLDLNDINNLTFSSVPNNKKTYQDLDETILNSREFHGIRLVNPTVKFLDMTGKDISNDYQRWGQFQVKIIASKDKSLEWKWKGETNLIFLSLKQNLETITDLHLDNLVLDKNESYGELKKIILNSREFHGIRLVNPTVKFLDMTGKDINENTKEHEGKFQVIIYASDIDNNWNGHTKNIILSLNSIPIPPTPTPHNGGLSAIANVGIALASIIILGGIWLVTQFQIIPRIKIKKMIKKHNKELQEFENKEKE